MTAADSADNFYQRAIAARAHGLGVYAAEFDDPLAMALLDTADALFAIARRAQEAQRPLLPIAGAKRASGHPGRKNGHFGEDEE